MSRRPRFAVLFGIALAVAPFSLAADDFSLERLRAGEAALAAKRIPEAVDQLRIACFGLLDQVDALSECLVHLTLAQDAAKRPAEVEATLVRFLDVEKRFAAYAKATVPQEARRDFQAILLSRVPQATILSIPSLASLVETEEQKIAKLPPAERVKALEAAARREPAATKWLIALAQARVALKQYRRALDDMAKLPGDAWPSHPELFADLFVCEVETKDWSAADGSEPRIPPALLKRPDVEKAVRDLADERARRTAR
ncbi:MAG: hypothetical protein WCC53_06795 [Thermoanaerobaculia bacterium]